MPALAVRLSLPATHDQQPPRRSAPRAGDCGISLSIWIVVAGAIQLPLAQFPDMGSMDVLTALSVLFCAIYCLVAVVLSIVDGKSSVGWSASAVLVVAGRARGGAGRAGQGLTPRLCVMPG